MYMYKRQQFVYLKETAKKIRECKRRFNIKQDLYVFISKMDEGKCKKPMEIYKNYIENKNFEKNKRELLDRNETGHGKCKITFSKKAIAEFSFLIQNVQFSESKLRTAARKMKMSLEEFMAYYSHKKKLQMEAKAKEQVVKKNSRNKRTAVERGIKKKIDAAPNCYSYPEVCKEEVKHTKYKELRVCLTKIDMEVSHMYTHTTAKKEKIFESSQIAAIPSKNEFYEEEVIVPEILPERKIEGNLFECITKKNIDMGKKKVSRAQHTRSQTATKRKIEDTEKTRKIPRNLESMHMHSTEKNNRREGITHISLSPPDALTSEEHTLLHPGLLYFDQREKHSNSVDIHCINDKIESTEIATAPSENTPSEKDKREHLHLYIHPEELPIVKIQEAHYACAEEVTRELSNEAKEECVANTVCDVHHTLAHTAAKNDIEEGETERTKMETPQNVEEGLYSFMHSIEKNKRENERDNLHLSSPLQSFDEIRTVSNSVEVIEFLKDGIDSSAIGGEGIQEDQSSHVCPVTEESALDMYISAETVFLNNTERDMEVKCHVHSHTAIRKVGGEGEGMKETESLTHSVNRLSFHMYDREENTNINTHPTPDSPKSDEEIIILSFDESGKQLSSVEDIEHVFESTEIADENCLNERKKFMENSVEKFFSEKLVGIEEDLHTYKEESSGMEIPQRGGVISEDPGSHMCVNPAEDAVLECENVHDGDLGFLLPEDYLFPDAFPEEGEKDEISEGYFFLPLSHSKQYEDISSDSVIFLSDDQTYVNNDTPPSCSVEDKAHFLQSESIKSEFVYPHKKFFCTSNKSIGESSAPFTHAYTSQKSHVTIHPPFDKEVAKTMLYGIKPPKVTASLPSRIYDPPQQKQHTHSDEVIILDDDEPEKTPSLPLEVYDKKNTHNDEIVTLNKDELEEKNITSLSKIKYPSQTVLFGINLPKLPSLPSGVCDKETHTQTYEVITLDDDDDECEEKKYPSKQNFKYSNYSKPSVPKYFTGHPPPKITKTAFGMHVNLPKLTVSLPSVYNSGEVVVSFNEDEGGKKNIYEREKHLSENYHSNNLKLIYQPLSNKVPKYDAASFYDIMSSEVLEDKI